MAVKRDLSVDQGATFEYTFTWNQAARDAEGNVIYDTDPVTGEKTPRPGTAIDITGFTARLQIRKSFAEPTLYLSLTSANGGIVLGGTNGQVTIYITDEQTAALPGSGIYDLELENPAGKVFKLLKGKVRLAKEVTV